MRQKSKLKKNSIWLIGSLCLLLAACSPRDMRTAQVTEIVGETAASVTSSLTMTTEPTNTISPTLLLNPTPTLASSPSLIVIAFEDIPSGLYPVTVSTHSLNVYSLDGEFVGILWDEYYYTPSINPDGLIIAGQIGNDLGFIDLISKSSTTFSFLDLFGFNPSWSPDSERLVLNTIVDAGLSPHLTILEISTGEYWRITFWDGREGDPSWSPDGNWIAFSSSHSRGYLFDLFLMETTCIDEPDTCPNYIFGPINNDKITASEPSWMPESRRIVFGCSDEEASFEDICLIDIFTREITKITDTLEGEIFPNVSPDGNWIAFQDSYNGGVSIMRSDGTDKRLITRDDSFGFWLAIP